MISGGGSGVILVRWWWQCGTYLDLNPGDLTFRIGS